MRRLETRTRPTSRTRGARPINVVPVLILAFLVFALWNAGVLAVLLEPASRLAGERTSPARYLLRAAILGAIWGAAFTAFFVFVFRRRGIVSAADAAILAIPIFTACGFSLGLAMRRLSPLPNIVAPMALAGVATGAVWTWAVTTINTAIDVYAVLAGLIFYSAAPALAVYPSAIARRRRLRAYDRGDCLACGFQGGAIHTTDAGRCPECGEKRRVCHRCRRIVDRASGETCPHCRATIDAACWRCGYDWTGVTEPTCPECGGWKASQSGV